MHAIHGRVLPNFSFSFPNSSWQSAMNSMRNLNACHPWQSAAQFFFFLTKLSMALCHEWHVDKLNAWRPWQSAAQFFFFLPKLFMALCHEWHVDKLNACHPCQSAAQFFFFLPKLFMALCHEWHVQSKCMPSMAECCPIFVFPSQTLHGTLP